MDEKAVGQIQEAVREVFSKSKTVSFKTDKSLDNLIKKLGKSLRDIKLVPLVKNADSDQEDDGVEKMLVGRIQVTKIGEKSENLHRVSTPGDTAVGDKHSEKFHGRPSPTQNMG